MVFPRKGAQQRQKDQAWATLAPASLGSELWAVLPPVTSVQVSLCSCIYFVLGKGTFPSRGEMTTR